METLNRRRFLWNSIASLALATQRSLFAQPAPTSFEPWREGHLDIHHIATGRGNSVLMILPDGTALMFDAGAIKDGSSGTGLAFPNSARRPGEWIGRYARQHLRATPKQQLDYFILSHFHSDHMGEITAASPLSPSGDYRLTGITDVAELLPIRHLLDRGYPTYSYPAPLKDDSTLNYICFANSLAKHGAIVEQFVPGSATQIVPQHAPEKYPVKIQNLAANGTVWTGTGNTTKALFPEISTLKPGNLPTENSCSCALRLSYGKFSYYIGGDLTCDTNFGAAPWMDVESAVAKAAGPVSVAALDHHGYYDATGPEFVRAMQARLYILQSWHASHPALSVLNELYSPILSPGQHDVLATDLIEAASLADSRLSDKMLSQHGHIVIRVQPGGEQYEAIILDNTTEEPTILKHVGLYQS